MRSIRNKINLFKKISKINFATDYSSIDSLYPPLFVWKKTKTGGRIQKGKFLKKIEFKSRYNFYVHFPFCRYKCAFCRQFSFPTTEKSRYDNYVDLLLKEAKLYAPYFANARSKLVGLYLGGGTPTLFNLERFLKGIYKNFDLISSFYLNIESTPDSLDRRKLMLLKKMGLSRLLIGIQSFDPKVLKIIGRPIDQLKIFEKVYGEARKINIPVINAELVCGLPGQSEESFIKDLKHLIDLKLDSIHIYKYLQTPLTLLGRKNGSFPASLSVSAKKMYDIGSKILKNTGYSFEGDDFALSNNARNPSFSYKNSVKSYRYQHQLALGMSSLGYYSLFGRGLLRTFNTINFDSYDKLITQKLLPIDKFYYINTPEEAFRRGMIFFFRYGKVSDEILKSYKSIKGIDCKDILDFFKEEFEFLKKMKQIKINKKFSTIKFKKENYEIYSKIFYSQEVLEKCQKFIRCNKELLE